MRKNLRRFDLGAVVVLMLAVLANLAGTAVATSGHHTSGPAVSAAGTPPGAILDASGPGGDEHDEDRCLFCEPIPSVGLPGSPGPASAAALRDVRGESGAGSPLTGIVPPAPSARAPPLT
jgi:hypothetical protein